MASVSAPTTPHKLNFTNAKFYSAFRLKRSPYPSSPSSVSCPWFSSIALDSTLCRCVNPSSDSPSPDDNLANSRWDSLLHDVVTKAIKRFDSYVNSWRNHSPNVKEAIGVVQMRETEKDADVVAAQEDEDANSDWNWDQWRKHFDEVDEQERLVSVLKSNLDHAVYREDFDDAARLKIAITAAANNDTVGKVMSCLNRAIEGERYMDAVFLRDKAGAGLVGWWTGISKDCSDPRGLIIRITPEHGRYVARLYNPRQLARSAAGVPLFEIFLTENRQGEYKLQAVYLKRKGGNLDQPIVSNKSLGAAEKLSPLDSPVDGSDLFVVGTDDFEGVDNGDSISDPAEGLPGFQNMLTDMISGMKVRIIKVTTPEKVDKDMISEAFEQDEATDDDDDDDDDDDEDDQSEDEDDDNTSVLETNIEMKGLDLEDLEVELEQEKPGKIKKDADSGTLEVEEGKQIALKFVLDGLINRLSSNVTAKDLIRVPAELERNGHVSFSFTLEADINEKDSHGKEPPSIDKSRKIRSQRSIDNVMFDLARFVGKEKVPLKVLKDVGKIINQTISQAKHRQLLSGSTVFNRIHIPVSSDPLSGLYVGAHGLHSSEVIQLRRRIGQWKEESGMKNPSDLEFYEYVEALKLTGDPYVPAGQVSFRAKVGKRYQLPHKGIIPEEFGVIARYKGQGRLAEPGFRNPRWVDGELVILDGKYIKGGPVVGFVYWVPEFHFLVFFNRLRLQE